MHRPPTEPPSDGPPLDPETSDVLAELEDEWQRDRKKDVEARTRRAADRAPVRLPGSMRKTSRRRLKAPGIGADFEVPFASGLVCLHPTNAPTVDEGLIAVSTPLHEEDKHLLRAGYWFCYEEAQRVCDFIENNCRHYQGPLAGQLIKLEKCQRQYIRRLFGWYGPDNTRRYREVFKFVARGNGKTIEAAALEVFLTGADGELGPVVLASATTKEQAGFCYTAARNMIEGSEELSQHFEVRTSSMDCHLSNGILKVVTGKPGDGDNPHAAVVDEYHEAKSSVAYDSIRTGMGKRRQPLLITITTAGFNIGGPCHKLYEYAQKVFYGIISAPHFLPVIYEPPEGADPFDPETWKYANPMLGVSLSQAEMAKEAADARMRPDYLPAFLTKRLNIWTNATHTWMDMARWKASAGKVPADLAAFAGRDAYGGLDLAHNQDLCALVFIIPWDDATKEQVPASILQRTHGQGFDVWARFYLPEDGIDEKAKKEGVPYRAWAKSGHLVLTPGDATDYDFIKADILKARDILQIREIGFDQQFASMLAGDLVNNHDIKMTKVMQTYTELTAPIQLLERLVLARGWRHGNNPILTWTVSNTVMKPSVTGAKIPSKKDSRGHIDGVPAMLNALHRAMVSMHQGTTATGVDIVDI